MKTSKLKTKWASSPKSLNEEKRPDQRKVSKEEWKGQSQRPMSEDIFKDFEKDMEEDAACVSNVAIGAQFKLSCTVVLLGPDLQDEGGCNK